MKVCKWTYGGRTKSLYKWAVEFGFQYNQLSHYVRLARKFGLQPNDALANAIWVLTKRKQAEDKIILGALKQP